MGYADLRFEVPLLRRIIYLLGPAKQLFARYPCSAPLFSMPPGYRAWDITADGKRFLFAAPVGQRFVMVKPSEQERTAIQINVVLNWFEDLKHRVGPPGKQ